ncbi:hypothetical protein Q1695_011021 [Nippostrongylus brasiliensis]|nr:hypothetical protein Q1695_011021 [Nippostrongylus brasiliensis]
MLLKVALVALVFVAVHGQNIGNPEDRVAHEPVARPRRGAAGEITAGEIMDDLMGPLGPTNGRQRRSPDSLDELEKEFDDILQEKDEKVALKKLEESLKKLVAELKEMPSSAK